MAGPLKVLGFFFWLFSLSFVRGQDKLTLMLKPPIERELFVNNKVVLEAVVSGDKLKTVKEASVSCKVKNETVTSVARNLDFPEGTSQFIRTHYIFVDTEKWFDGEMVTCSIHDRSVTRDIKQEISFDRGVKIQTPTLSLVPVITQKSTSVMCVIEDFYPKKLTVQLKVNNNNCTRQSNLEYKLNAEGLYNTHSLCKVSSETWNANNEYTCVVNHLGKVIRVRKYFKDKLTLTLKPPIERELFVNNRVVLEAVVSGDDRETVKEASVSCKVKNETVIIHIGNINFSKDISKFIQIHNFIIDTNKWFYGEMVTCSIHDRSVNRDIKQEISFDKGDEKTPSVVIHTPDTIRTDTVSLVCEVTSSKLGDVYIMWKVENGPYIKGSTSAPIQQDYSISVLSILTVTKQEYEDPRKTFTCAVIYTNKHNIRSPLQFSTSQRKASGCSVDY